MVRSGLRFPDQPPRQVWATRRRWSNDPQRIDHPAHSTRVTIVVIGHRTGLRGTATRITVRRTLGLLANGKVNGDQLLVAIGDILHAQYGAVIGPTIVKPHASLPAAPEALDTFASSVAIVLSAIGD